MNKELCQLSQTPIKEFIQEHFLINNDTVIVLPIKKLMIKGEEKFKGSKSSLSIEQLKEYGDKGFITLNGKHWENGVKLEEADYWELRLRHTDRIVCIDIDGQNENGDITLEQFWKIPNLPEWFKLLPYSLSRKKKLPHFYFKLDGKDLSKLEPTFQECFKLFKGDLLVNHVWEKTDSVLYNYESLPIINWTEMKKIINDSSPGKKLLNEPKILKEETDSETLSTTSSKSTSPKIEQKLEQIYKMVTKMQEEVNFFDTTPEWHKLGYILANESDQSEEGLEMYIDLSLTFETDSGKKHDEKEIKKFWYKVDLSRPKKKKLTIATLIKDYKDIFPEEAKITETSNYYTTPLYISQKEEFEKKVFKLETPLTYVLEDKDQIHFYSKSDIVEFCVGKYAEIVCSPLPKKDFIHLWREDNDKRTYEKMVFEPNISKVTEKEYNLFKGFDKNINAVPVIENDSKFLKLLKYICVEESIYTIMKSWIAHIIQKPYKKTNVAPIFYSRIGGVGKNAIVDGIMKLLGNVNCGTVESIEDIVKNFNAHLCNKLFIYGDEINANAKKVADKLKGVITRPEQNLEKKGVDSIKVADYTNWLFTTNNENCFKVEEGDRRLYLIKCPEIPLDKQDYKDFYEEINDTSKVDSLFTFFLNYKNTDFEMGVDRVPSTKYKEQLLYENKPAYVQMLFKSTSELAFNKYSSTKLFELSVEYAKKNYLSSNFTMTEFGKVMTEYLSPFKKRSSSGWVYEFDKALEIRKHLYSKDTNYYRYVYNLLETDPAPTFIEESK